MNDKATKRVNAVEEALIAWADSREEGERCPACLRDWGLDEDQLEIIKEACAVPYGAASIANAMWCITDEEGLTSIAEVLRTGNPPRN